MKYDTTYKHVRLAVSPDHLATAQDTYTNSVSFDTVPTLHIPSTYDTTGAQFRGLQVPHTAKTTHAELMAAVQRTHNRRNTEPFSAPTPRNKRSNASALGVTPAGLLVRRDYPSTPGCGFRGSAAAQCSKAHCQYTPAQAPRTILCYVDGRPHTWVALDWTAARLARTGDHIVVVTALPGVRGSHTHSTSAKRWAQGYARDTVLGTAQCVQGYLSLVLPPSVAARTTVEIAVGKAGTVVASAVNVHRPHLVVMATKRRAGSQPLLQWRGSRLVDRVATRYPVPVCLVPAGQLGKFERGLEALFAARSGCGWAGGNECAVTDSEGEGDSDSNNESSFNSLLNRVHAERRVLRGKISQMGRGQGATARATASGGTERHPDKLALLSAIVHSSTLLCAEIDRGLEQRTTEPPRMRRGETAAPTSPTVVFTDDTEESGSRRTRSISNGVVSHSHNRTSTTTRSHGRRRSTGTLRKTRSNGSASSGQARRWSQGSGARATSTSTSTETQQGSSTKKKLSRFLPFGKF